MLFADTTYLIISDIQKNMGNQNLQKVKEPQVFHQQSLIVATLNYCGIAFSPFEFYFHEYEKELQEISHLFRKLLPQYFPHFDEKKFKWEMGKVEKTFKKGRYSNMFSPDVGIIQGRLISKQQFEHKWDVEFAHHVDNLKLEWKNEEKDTVRLYDFIMYHVLLAFVYGTESFQDAIKNDPAVFLNKLKPLYEISFLNEQKKLEKFKIGLAKLNPDVFFIQEYSRLLLDELKSREKYHITVDPKEDSLVLLRKDAFKKIADFSAITDEINFEQKKGLKWAQSIAIVGGDNYIFASLHLSSSQGKNKEQVVHLKQDLLRMREALPKYELIVGGDINSFIEYDAIFNEVFHLYPRQAKEFTTLKKRTYSQSQFHKAEKEVKESKDRIISTLDIELGHVQFLNGEIANDQCYLPNHEHPHDHFVCLTRITHKK